MKLNYLVVNWIDEFEHHDNAQKTPLEISMYVSEVQRKGRR